MTTPTPSRRDTRPATPGPVTVRAAGVYAMREPVEPHTVALAIYPEREDGTSHSQDLTWVQLKPATARQLLGQLQHLVTQDGLAADDPSDPSSVVVVDRRAAEWRGVWS